MLISRKKEPDADAFWKTREEEIGSPILAKTLGKVIDKDNPAPLWGLFYFTKDSVFFQTFKSENWISLMLSGGKGSGRTRDEIIEIPVASIREFSIKERKGGLFGLLKQPPQVVLEWESEESGKQESLVFEMEGNAKAFVESLPR